MSSVPAIVPTWTARTQPLEPVAMFAARDVAVRLALRLLRMSDTQLSGLDGVSGDQMLAVLSRETALPWVDGVLYLGRDPRAPSLLLPCHTTCDVPPELLEVIVSRTIVEVSSFPVAMLPHERTMIPLGGARPIVRTRLTAWMTSP